MLENKNIPYHQVKSEYESIRQDSREVSHEQLPTYLPNKYDNFVSREDITLSGFTLDCQTELKKWETCGNRKVGWNWLNVQNNYRAHPKRFELSIWYKGRTLCGASIGKPTYSGGKLRLDYLEAAPMETPLDGIVTDLILSVATAYARAIGANQIRIMKPVNEKVKNHYLSKPGFSFDSNGNFCYRDLS